MQLTNLAALTLAVSLALVPAGFAQETSTDTETASAQLTADTITDAHIEAFVKVAIALEALRTEYTDKIGNAQSEDAQNELLAEADRVAIQLVDKARGITPDQYLAISKIAQEDAELATRISAQVAVMRTQKAEFEKQQAEAAKAQDEQRAAEALKAAEDTARETSGSE